MRAPGLRTQATRGHAMILLALALLAAPSLDKSWTFKPGAEPSVEVSNISGRIQVEAAAGSEVTVRATSRDPRDMRVEAEQDGSAVRVHVCCGDGCGFERRKSWHGDCDGGDIDLLVRVAPGAELRVTNVSGSVQVSGVRGPLTLNNVSGKTEVSGSADKVRIHSVSGDVRLAPSKAAATKVNTVSGDVHLALPRGEGATVSLSTLSGEIRGGEGDSSRRTIGGGGAKVAVQSVSGSVELVQH
jgi:hypothetical protein